MELQQVNINNPNTKYNTYNHHDDASEMDATTNAASETSNAPPANTTLSFFNYHEFLVNDYESTFPCHFSLLSSTTSPVDGTIPSKSKSKSIIVTHFPNNHVPSSSLAYKTTRIVRVPRIYDTHDLSYLIPQFSTYPPGTEPAALSDNENKSTFSPTPTATLSPVAFHPVGQFDNNNIFGLTSLTPLVPALVSEEEFEAIVSTVNTFLLEAFNPFNWPNFVENTLDFVSGTLYSKIFNRFVLGNYSQRKLMALEQYIKNDVNDKMFEANCRDIRIISPRRCGYLSLDFQIPKPSTFRKH